MRAGIRTALNKTALSGCARLHALLASTSVAALLAVHASPAHAQIFTVNSSPENVVVNPPPPTYTGVVIAGPTVTVAGRLINNGVIRSSTHTAVSISQGTILGGITNNGTISTSGHTALSVFLSASVSGGIYNSASGIIQGPARALWIGNTSANGNFSTFSGGITNSGMITSSGGIGVLIGANPPNGGGIDTFSGGITNTGTISAGGTGISLQSVSTFSGGISNSGTISAGGTGILLQSVSTFSGGISNTGTISASNIAILAQNTPSVSIFDAGTITGGSGTAIEFSSGINTLTLAPGFVINGDVLGAGTDVLQLGGSGTGGFNLNNIGVQYTGFTTFNVVSAAWVATGTNANNWSISSGATLQLGNGVTSGLINGNYADNGTLAFDEPSTTTIASAISGTGSVTQSGPGTVIFSGNNNYSGGTSITAGVLEVTNNNSLGTGSVQLNGGTLMAGATGLVLSNGVVIGSNGGTVNNSTGNLTLSGSISGSGQLTLEGLETITLTGNNLYSGGITISGGTLALSGSGSIANSTEIALNSSSVFNISGTTSGASIQDLFSLSSSASVVLGGKTLTITNGPVLSGNNTFAGFISGTGNVVIAGGVSTFIGSNSYTGTTTVAAGAELDVSNNAQSIATSSDVIVNGTLSVASVGGSIKSLSGSGTVVGPLTLTNASGTFAGVISDLGTTLTLQAGTETLTAVNTYTGSTNINSGSTLALSGAGSIASSSGITDNGTFDISATTSGASITSLLGSGTVALGNDTITLTKATGTFSGVVSGAGGVVLNGGTETLSGANTYAGATDIASGSTLALSGTGSIAASSSIADNGTLDISATTSGASVTTLSGSGNVVLGANTLTLTNASNTFSGVISGTGGLTLNGGNETLTGTDTYNGATTITGGTLTVMGSLAGSVTVNGGTLAGTGMVGSINAASGGTLAPGDAIGTLHVNGNVSFASGSIYAVQVSPSAADETVASGSVAIASGATLAITQNTGTYIAGTDFKLISAASITGSFSTVTGDSFSGLDSTIQYSATGVDLILSSASNTPPPAVTYMFGTYGQTPDQVAAGVALAAGSPTGTLYTSLGKVASSDAAAMPATLAQLSGDIHASMRSAMIEDGKIIRDTVINHAIAANDTVTVWGSGFGAYGTIAGDGNATDLHHNDAGVIFGADMPLMAGLNMGLGLALTDQAMSLPSEAASASGTTNHVLGYVNWGDDVWVVSLGWDYGWGANQVTRQITALSETDADHQSNKLGQIFGEVGYRLSTSLMTMEPYLDLADVISRTGAFSESAGIAALDGGPQSNSETYSTLGARATLPALSIFGISMVPNFNLGWQHAFNRFMPNQALVFAGTGESFNVAGVALDSDAATIQAGLDILLTPDASLNIDYDGEISSHVRDHAVRAELKWTF